MFYLAFIADLATATECSIIQKIHTTDTFINKWGKLKKIVKISIEESAVLTSVNKICQMHI